MTQKCQLKNRLSICVLSALCLMAMPQASAEAYDKELDIVGRHLSILKDLNLPRWEGGDSVPEPTCISKKDGFTRDSLNPKAFARCERRSEKCSLTGIRRDLKPNKLKKHSEFEITQASTTMEKSGVPVIARVHRNELFIYAQDLPQELRIWCQSKSRKTLTLADAEEILSGTIGLPEEREKGRGRETEPPRDGSAAGHVH